MNLINFKIENYQQFRKLEVNFAKGLNVIFGKNEAGKSTFVRALLDILFEQPDRRTNKVKAILSWHDEAYPRLQLEFEYNKNRYLLTKDWQKKEAELAIDSEGKSKTIKGVAEVEKYLEKILPSFTREIYESSAFITSDSVALLHKDDDGFKNALLNAAAGGASVEVSSILADLSKQRSDLRKGVDRHAIKPGQYKRLLDETAELKTKLAENKVELSKFNQAQLKLKTINEEYIKAKEKLESREDLFEKNTKIKKALADKHELSNKYEQINADISHREELSKKLALAKEKLNELPQFAWKELESDIENFKRNDELIKQWQTETEQKTTSKRTKESKNITQNYYLYAAIAVLAILISLALNNAIPLGIAIAVLAVLFIVSRNPKKQPVKEEVNHFVDDLLSKQQQFKETYKGYTLNELKKNLEKYDEYNAQVQKFENQLDVFANAKSIEQLNQDKAALLKEDIKLDVLLTELNADEIKLSAQDYNSYSQEITKTKELLKELEAEKIEAEVVVKNTNIDSEKITMLEEQLQFAEAELENVKKKLKVIDIVEKGLTEAVASTSNEAAGLVEAEVKKYLPRITANRYSKCRLNDNLSLDVYSEMKKDWCSCDVKSIELSRGTIDQIYLITRLAFIKLLAGSNKLPIIMDDPLLTFDAERKQQTLELLAEFAEDFQIIFFTFDKSIPSQTILAQT